ncbi:MAG: cytidylate kinase-like family protein [Chloroflexota bacterium]|nr:cytidylate kinase-like family protein [Chloroflexota bacterium]
MPVITVTGRLSSGARELAKAVAAALTLDYLDREILVQAARELGVSESDVEQRDERASSIGERLAGVLRTLMERSAAAGAADPISGGSLDALLAQTYGEAAGLPESGDAGQLDDEHYLRTLTSIIRGVAARGNVVILGRGSQAILQHEPETLHVYVTLPRPARVDTLIRREGLAPAEAERRIKQSDSNRLQFHRRYFKVEMENPCLYDLMIHAGRIAPDLAVQLIVQATRDRKPRPG